MNQPDTMPARILFVDDEPDFEKLIRLRFRKFIRNGEYEFTFASNGQEALEELKREPSFDMVVTDIQMPVMDGLALLEEIKKANLLLYTVVLSAYGDMDNIRQSMNQGAFDFILKPIDFTDLKTTIDKTLRERQVLMQASKAEQLGEENRQLSELDELKSRLFTNISHELRTPLTIITGITEQIEESPDRWLNKGLKMIRRNGHSLLNLVNQILDLRKLEMGKLQLHLIQSDIIQYLSYIVESFYSLAESNDIRLEFESEIGSQMMDYDSDKIVRIVTNLISNAIKFTPAGGEVAVRVNSSVQANTLSISVKDTGVGIAEDKLPHVFDRFYQVDDPETNAENGSEASGEEGTGIGLAIVREFVKLMDGTVKVESQVGVGTTFEIVLPIRQQAEIVKAASDGGPVKLPGIVASASRPAELLLPAAESSDQLPSLLLVEDNTDVVQYLVACLEDHYQLLIARDGQEGIDMAIERVPDLIISDVMMPRKGGYELCEELKTDERTSHIPIVLLTARVDDDSKLSGLKKGADAYLPKPFNKEELHIRLRKLLELRLKLQEKYQSLDHENGEEPTIEDEFIRKIRQEIEGNIDDENFGITELGRAIGMSRAQIHRKVKALTGRSTSIFIRSIRLHKAKAILQNTDLNISQVAYEVGFRDPKYFSRTFAEEFGQLPKAFRK